ncbi:MAG TPA: hypothetical protein EYN79_03400 [Planctomycetes bacterium]|nr:hypothetical protein [Planctomycetota bacterium]HIN79818.1 hypothetical protein [Planctomycetota bacterium]
MTRNLLLLLTLLVITPVVVTGCSAGSTYLRAIGSWQRVPEATIASTDSTPASPALGSWMKRMVAKVKETITSDMQLTIEASGAYTLVLRSQEYHGQLEVTSIFGEGLGVRTEVGPLACEARVRVLPDDRMVLEGAGTEITLVRSR